VIRWGRAPSNALTYLKVAGLATCGLNRNLLPAHYARTQGNVRLKPLKRHGHSLNE